jgi:hypothetical protein
VPTGSLEESCTRGWDSVRDIEPPETESPEVKMDIDELPPVVKDVLGEMAVDTVLKEVTTLAVTAVIVAMTVATT